MQSWLPEQASTYAAQMDDLVLYIFDIVAVWFIFAMLLLVGFAVAFKAKPGVKAKYIAGNTPGQIGILLGLVALITAFDFGIDVKNHNVWHLIKQTLPHDKVDLRIHSQQFGWSVVYAGPDGALGTADDVESAEFHVPVNKDIVFELISTDVIHSFSVPNFRLKQDAIPGRVILGWFNANKVGKWDIACSQICGRGHAMMAGQVQVDTEEAYKAWASANKVAAVEKIDAGRSLTVASASSSH